ncbi:hypothetical protein AgCh_018115 [Apium graveolens]
MKIIKISKAIAALVFLTVAVFTFSSASLLQEKNSLWISNCGYGSRKMAKDCRSGGSKPVEKMHENWFQSLKKKQSPPPSPVIKKKKQLKSTSLSFTTQPRF